MPIGAENIGTAYVRILVDGEKFGDSIEDQINDLDWKSVARKGSVKFQEEWEKERNKAPNQQGMRDSIAGPLVRGKWLSNAFFRGSAWQEFRMLLDKEFGKAGVRAGDNLEEGMLSGMNFDSLIRKMKNLTPELVKAQKELNQELLAEQMRYGDQYNREWDLMLADAHRMNVDFERKRRNLLGEAYAMNAEFNRKVIRLWRDQDLEFERHIKDHKILVDSLDETYQKIIADTHRLKEGHDLAFGSKGGLIRALEDYRVAMRNAGAATDDWEIDVRDMDRRIRLINPRISSLTTRIGKYADRAGAAFGRGARNDFINIVGVMVRGLVNLLSIFPRLIGKVFEFGQSMKFVFDEAARNTGSTFRGMMAVVIASLESGGAALGIFAVAAAGIVFIIGPVVSIFFALAGAISAVVGSIVFGLIGAVAALAGALVPLAAGIGVVVGAFMSLDKEAKKALSNDFKPVVDSFKELGEIAADNLFEGVGKSAEVLADVLERMQPMVEGIATSLNTVFRDAVDSLDSPRFNTFLQKWTKFLPDAVESLGNSLVSFGVGLGGVFTASIPLVEQFLGWLERISTQFAEWATSKEGQEEIKTFLRDAAESAKSLGGFLESAGGFLGTLFSAGQSEGNSLLDSLAGTLDRWAKFIRENPDAVGKFFTNAGEVARDLGRVAEAVGRIIDVLDNPGTRKAAQGMFTAIQRGIQGIVTIGSPAVGALLLIIQAVGKVRGAFQKMPTTIGEVRTRVNGILDSITQKFAGMKDRIAANLTGFGVILMGPFVTLLAFVSTVPASIVNYFRGLGAKIVAAIGSINIDWPDPPGWMQNLTGGFSRFAYAQGGLVNGPVRALIGEAGPEAVVPLNRPLSQVDPAVRWLSAIAQGKALPMAAGGMAGGKSISADGWTIVSNSEDPETVAKEVFNRLVAGAY